MITCPDLPEDTYGYDHVCLKVCPDGQYADKDTNLCVAFDDCPTDTWSDIISKHCVSRCPEVPGYFGYNATTSCVDRCPEVPDLYADQVTQTCEPICSDLNGEMRFADPVSRSCVFVCPIEEGLYGDPFTGRCTDTCDSSNAFKDNSTQRCTAICPSNPDYYSYTNLTDN